MPSPKGSNREALYVLRGRRASVREAHDASPGSSAEDPTQRLAALRAVARWAVTNLSEGDRQILADAITGKADAVQAELDKPAASQAADARPSFEKRFPNANRLGRA